MLYKFIFVLYGATLFQDVLVKDASSIQTTTLQKEILKILAPHRISSTFKKVCVSVLRSTIQLENCFPKTFPTADNITGNLVKACVSLNLIMLRTIVKNASFLKRLDYSILLACLYSLPSRIHFTQYLDFIRLLRSSNYFVIIQERQHILFNFLAVVRKNNSTFTFNDDDFIFKAWLPLATDVIGMAAYNNQTYLDLGIKSSLPGSDDKDVDVAFSLEIDFLNKLVEKFSTEEKIELRVVILFIKNNEMSRLFSFPYSQILGIDFGGICINNELTIIRILYSSMLRGYSQNDFDPVGCTTLTCLFPRMLFVSLTRTKSYYQKFCRRTQTTAISTMITWSPAPVGSPMFPAKFCLTKNCTVPEIICLYDAYEPSDPPTEECYEDDNISSHAEQLYEYYKCCHYDEEYCKIYVNTDIINSYTDAKITMSFLKLIEFKYFYGSKLTELSHDVLDKGFEFLARKNRKLNNLYCMLDNIHPPDFFNYGFDTYSIKRREHVYFNNILRKQKDRIGIALYKNKDNEDFSDYHIKYITDKNVSYDYSTDDVVEVVIYLSNESRNQIEQDEYMKQSIFIVRNSSFMNNSTLSCRSRIVVFYEQHSWSWGGTSEYIVYLKTVEDGLKHINMFRREGYWFNITIRGPQYTAFCISELNGNVCNTVKQVMIYTFNPHLFLYTHIKIDSTTNIKTWNQTMIPLDMLSQLTISMNPRMKWMFQNYFYLFNSLAITESTLSALGLICIFSSALILKDWCEKKFNTVQLSITLSLEITFFLIDVDKITHLGYLIFYYSILAQFTWMLIIGYHQYLKFVKVFTSSSINRKKSLILGWFAPAQIMLFPVLLHPDCLKCNLCYKNEQIFNYFIIGPISLIIVTNLIIYIVVMYNITRIRNEDTSDEVRRAKLRAAILFPFLLGISWISIFALISPWSWIAIGGSFMFYIVTPSQGFVVFVFAVLLDNHTVIEWRSKFSYLLAKMDRKKRSSKTEENELKIA